MLEKMEEQQNYTYFPSYDASWIIYSLILFVIDA